MTDRWYSDGLRFECHRCGECCVGGNGYVWVGTAEIERLAQRLEMSLNDFGRRFLRQVNGYLALTDVPGGGCVFYANGCQVYEARPDQCRTFPFWTKNLMSPDAWQATAARCPGMNTGPRHPVANMNL